MLKVSELQLKDFKKVGLPFVSIFMVGCVLRAATPLIPLPWWIAKDVIVAIADAIMVAGVVGIGLELFATSFFW